MKIPIILTPTRGKSPEKLVKEVMTAFKKFQKVKERAEKQSEPKDSEDTEKSSENKKLRFFQIIGYPRARKK